MLRNCEFAKIFMKQHHQLTSIPNVWLAMWRLLDLDIFLQMYHKLISVHHSMRRWFVDQIFSMKQYNLQHYTPVAFDFPEDQIEIFIKQSLSHQLFFISSSMKNESCM